MQAPLTTEVEQTAFTIDKTYSEDDIYRFNVYLQEAIDDGTETVVVEAYSNVMLLSSIEDTTFLEKRTQLQNMISTNGWSVLEIMNIVE